MSPPSPRAGMLARIGYGHGTAAVKPSLKPRVLPEGRGYAGSSTLMVWLRMKFFSFSKMQTAEYVGVFGGCL